MQISIILKTAILLVLSNLFMTFAWYGHLRILNKKSWFFAAIISWLIAFFEYIIQVPANRFGHVNNLSLAQLKILQEVITLSVFIPFSIYFMHEKFQWNYLWACICMVAAVFFVFRG